MSKFIYNIGGITVDLSKCCTCTKPATWWAYGSKDNKSGFKYWRCDKHIGNITTLNSLLNSYKIIVDKSVVLDIINAETLLNL
jgi:hypothetical protein